MQEHAGDLAGQAAAGAGSVVEVFTALALAIFCTVFFLARGREMWTWFLNQLPSRVRDSWKTAGGAGWYTFSGYTRGTVIIAVTDGMLAFILLSVLRVPLSAPLAVLVFIGAFIPLIGAPLAMVIAMIVALAANGLLSAAIVGIGIALIGQFEGHILQPIVMGKQVSIHPVVIALAVTAGTLTAGILGAVISVPLVAVCWAVFSRLRTLDPPMEEDEADDDVEPVETSRRSTTTRSSSSPEPHRKSRDADLTFSDIGVRCSATRLVAPSARSSRPRTTSARDVRATLRNFCHSPAEQMTLSSPVSSSRDRNVTPPAVPGRCRCVTTPGDGHPPADLVRVRLLDPQDPGGVEPVADELRRVGVDRDTRGPHVRGRRSRRRSARAASAR